MHSRQDSCVALLVLLGRWLAATALCWLTLVAPLHAAPPSAKRALHVAPGVSYEQQRTDRVLAEHKLVIEPAPEGKRIAFVRIVRDDVYVKEEIWPLWWNWFHGRTREYVVRRELLFEEGVAYQEARIEETMRNLRGMGIFGIVRIVPVQGARPAEVGVLVHTRDLWSLRPETGFNISGKVINSFVLRGTEINAFGRNKAPSVEYSLAPKTYELAQGYYARRVLLSSVALKERVGFVLHRGSNRYEGEVASISVGQPYYRLAQRLAWEAAFSHTRYIARGLADGQVTLFPSPLRNPEGPFADVVFRYRYERAYAVASWREGERFKHAVNLGWDFRTLRTRAIRETNLPDVLRDRFAREIMPQNRTDNGPTLRYDFFVPSWVTFVNLTSYGVSENVRVGPSVVAGMRVPLRALGSTKNAWSLSADAGAVFAPHGFLIDVGASGVARLQQGRWIDQRATFQLRGATPVFWIFRFVMRSYLELRRHDSQNTLVTLGAGNGLRGYGSQVIQGRRSQRFLANFELRTLPIEWQAVHVGAVLFYDVGSVFYRPDDFRPYHSVGIGIRIMFPQINRSPFTVDGGLSFDPQFHFQPSYASGQAVPLTAAEDLE